MTFSNPSFPLIIKGAFPTIIQSIQTYPRSGIFNLQSAINNHKSH